jgi:hypothetical protein
MAILGIKTVRTKTAHGASHGAFGLLLKRWDFDAGIMMEMKITSGVTIERRRGLYLGGLHFEYDISALSIT